MESMIELDGGIVARFGEFEFKVILGLLIGKVKLESILDEQDVVFGLEFREARGKHECEECDELGGIFANDVVSTAADGLEPFKVLLAHNAFILIDEDKVSLIHVLAQYFAIMSKEVAKVDVEQVTLFAEHDVIIVAISKSKDERNDGITGARVDEIFNRLVQQFIGRVVLFQPFKQCGVVQNSSKSTQLNVNV